MAIDKLMNQTQGEDIISKLGDIATTLENVTTVEPAKFGMGYAVCNTAAGTAAKTANIANYTLTEGALVTVKFTNGNTASNATLNISSTGAKPLLYKGSALTSDIISADDICTFIYSTANSGSYNIINVDALSGAGAGTVKSVGAEGGLTTDQTSGAAISTTGNVKLNLKSESQIVDVSNPDTTTTKTYPVALDSDGYPGVAVPWTDTTYSTFTDSADGLVPAADGTGETGMFLKGDGTWATPTDTNTTYTVETGTANGKIKVTPSNDTAYEVPVYGLNNAAYKDVATSIPASGADDTKVATEKAVADSISGKAIGANSSTTNAIATFAGTDGKTLADSAVTIAKDATGVTDDDTKVPTSKAVKTYVDATATGISRYIGTITATSQLSTTAKKGDFYIVSTAWTGVHAGDEIIAEKDDPAQTIDGTNWTLLHNEADTNTTYAFAEGTDNGKFTVTPSDTGTAQSVTVHGLKSAAYTESTAYATSSHVHGNITNAGALQTTDVSIATGDKLVVTDASDSNKVARTSAAFDTTVTTKCLTQAGTFADFNNYTHPTTAGNKHIPTSGATGNYLKYGGSSGTAAWAAPLTSWPTTPTNTDTLPSTKLIADRFTTNESNILSVEDMVCATEFSSSTAYAVGDMVTYEHKLYKFINAHQGAWSASDVQNYDLTRMVNDLQKKAVKVYTYHINPNESDPEDAVTYLDDATGLTPAKMGASSFSYGSWANAWFLPRPCVLKFDGTVDYYLNPNDYSKKTDGTASTIDSSNSTGNVMLEFPKIWVKRVNDGNGARTVSIAPVNVDGTYKCWSNINAEDKEVDHFYLPAYNGTIHSSKMRSLSGVTLNSTYAPNYTRAQEVTAATANNPTGKNMWYTETWADFCLIYDLLYLMGKSLDVQRTFGQGLSSGSETAMRAYVTGTYNAKGLFYGDVSGTSKAVKVLGMENLWGCRWHGVAGLINDNGALKVKMTYGVADGSTAVGYNTTGSGYLNYGSTYGTAGYVKKMQADNTMGYKIIETAGTDATYYCDYYYVNNSQSNYALLGGRSGSDAACGFYVSLDHGAAYASWAVGGSLSCRP